MKNLGYLFISLVWLIISDCQIKPKKDDKAVLNTKKETNLFDMAVMDHNGNQVIFKNLMNKQSVLCFAYSTSSCPPCVSDYLEIMDSVRSLIGEHGKIIIITNQDNLRTLRILKSKFPDLSFYNQGENFYYNSYSLKGEKPVMFIAQQNLKISHFRRGLAEDSIGNPYFREVIKILKTD